MLREGTVHMVDLEAFSVVMFSVVSESPIFEVRD